MSHYGVSRHKWRIANDIFPCFNTQLQDNLTTRIILKSNLSDQFPTPIPIIATLNPSPVIDYPNSHTSQITIHGISFAPQLDRTVCRSSPTSDTARRSRSFLRVCPTA